MDFIGADKLRKTVRIRGLRVGQVLYRLHRYYCKPMKTKGMCDYNCEVTCKTSLERVFRSFDIPRDRYALIVWRMREAVAANMEGEVKEIVPETTVFGEPKFGNVFEFLLEEMDESKAEAS